MMNSKFILNVVFATVCVGVPLTNAALHSKSINLTKAKQRLLMIYIRNANRATSLPKVNI